MSNTSIVENPMADLHLHAIKPATPEALKLGIVTEAWVPSEYRGVSTNEFLEKKLSELYNKQKYSTTCLLDIVNIFHKAHLPAPPHLLDAIYHAVTDDDYPDVLTFLTIGTPSCFTMEETIRAMEAFTGDLQITIIPTAPLSLDANEMATRLNILAPKAGKTGYRPVVKAHPLIQQFHLGEIPEDVFKVLNEHGALLVIHTGVFQGSPCVLPGGIRDIDAADPEHLRKFAGDYPQVDFLLSHMGTPDRVVAQYWLDKGRRIVHFRDTLRMVLDFPNVYGDIGGLMFSAPTEGKYGEPKSEEPVDFAPRCELAFESIQMRLDDPVNYASEMPKKLRPTFRSKIVHGSDFPVTSISELKKQMRVMGTATEGKKLREIKDNIGHRAYKLARKR